MILWACLAELPPQMSGEFPKVAILTPSVVGENKLLNESF